MHQPSSPIPALDESPIEIDATSDNITWRFDGAFLRSNWMCTTIDPDRFQFHREAAASGVFAPGTEATTRRTALVDDACIFLNRPGFSGGAGCALHLQAEADGEAPIDWKPSVCWQLPLRITRHRESGAGEVAELRRWGRDDWGSGGQGMAWCCTEEAAAYAGDAPVIHYLRDELVALVGHEVYVELEQKALSGDTPPAQP